MSSPTPSKRPNLNLVDPWTHRASAVKPSKQRSQLVAEHIAKIKANRSKNLAKTRTSQPGCLSSPSSEISLSWAPRAHPLSELTTASGTRNQNGGHPACSGNTLSPAAVHLTSKNVVQSDTPLDTSTPLPIQVVPAFNLEMSPHSSNFGAYLNTTNFSDVVLEADEREFHAHKIILANRSTYFAKLFEEDNNIKSRIEFADAYIRADTLEQVLKFIYSGQVDSFEKISELCVAAENFALDGLKCQCTQYLIQNLNPDEAASVLVLASNNNMPELKERCISYINRNAQRVIRTASYTDLVVNHTVLLDELYKDLVRTANIEPALTRQLTRLV